jgi:hypothetical protein
MANVSKVQSVRLPPDQIMQVDVTQFTVEVTPISGGAPWHVLHSYNDFVDLCSQLEDPLSAPFPSKHFTGCNGVRLQNGREALEAWLSEFVNFVQSSDNAALRASTDAFLQMPAPSAAATPITSTAQAASSPNGATACSTIQLLHGQYCLPSPPKFVAAGAKVESPPQNKPSTSVLDMADFDILGENFARSSSKDCASQCLDVFKLEAKARPQPADEAEVEDPLMELSRLCCSTPPLPPERLLAQSPYDRDCDSRFDFLDDDALSDSWQAAKAVTEQVSNTLDYSLSLSLSAIAGSKAGV